MIFTIVDKGCNLKITSSMSMYLWLNLLTALLSAMETSLLETSWDITPATQFHSAAFFDNVCALVIWLKCLPSTPHLPQPPWQLISIIIKSLLGYWHKASVAHVLNRALHTWPKPWQVNWTRQIFFSGTEFKSSQARYYWGAKACIAPSFQNLFTLSWMDKIIPLFYFLFSCYCTIYTYTHTHISVL